MLIKVHDWRMKMQIDAIILCVCVHVCVHEFATKKSFYCLILSTLLPVLISMI